MQRRIQILTFVLLMPLAFSSFAQIERFIAGTHYIELTAPVNTRDASKVEVLEVFWYGCPHCFTFEPLIENWSANSPADVDFMRFPAIWNGLMEVHAKIYYTAENMDALAIVHEHVFNAINVEGNRLQNEDQIGALFASHGINQDDFSKAFNSFSVRTKLNQAKKRMQDYEIRSTPNMVVNGKYLVTTGDNVRSQVEMLEVVDFLVEKERLLLSSSAE